MNNIFAVAVVALGVAFTGPALAQDTLHRDNQGGYSAPVNDGRGAADHGGMGGQGHRDGQGRMGDHRQMGGYRQTGERNHRGEYAMRGHDRRTLRRVCHVRHDHRVCHMQRR